MEKKLDFRIEKTYLFLRKAFTELLNEKRFEDFTVNELCERAMIRRTTFYKHFADKYEYFAFYVKEIASDFRKQIPEEVRNDDLHTHILHMSRALLRFMNQHKKLVDHVLDSNMYPILQDSLFETIMQDVLDILQNTNAAQNMTDHQMKSVAAFYSGGLLSTIRMWLRQGEQINEGRLLAMIETLPIH